MEALYRSVFVGLLIMALPAFASPGEALFQSQCVRCHSVTLENPDVPILFRQERGYIEEALLKFQTGARIDHIRGEMGGISQNLSDENRKELSRYLVAENVCSVNQEIDVKKEGFIESFRAGAELEKKYNCQHCHGSFHHAAPRLYGQKRDFLIRTLWAFKNQTRVDPLMNRFAGQLSAEEIENLATYLNGMILMRQCP